MNTDTIIIYRHARNKEIKVGVIIQSRLETYLDTIIAPFIVQFLIPSTYAQITFSGQIQNWRHATRQKREDISGTHINDPNSPSKQPTRNGHVKVLG